MRYVIFVIVMLWSTLTGWWPHMQVQSLTGSARSTPRIDGVAYGHPQPRLMPLPIYAER